VLPGGSGDDGFIYFFRLLVNDKAGPAGGDGGNGGHVVSRLNLINSDFSISAYFTIYSEFK
jgi:GTPase involved in cell partitioning and DNA repair